MSDHSVLQALPASASDAQRDEHYRLLHKVIASLLQDENDWISAMATVSCELHHAFEYFHWTGFYRTIAPGLLAVGPYQGGHGCLRIPFERGVCGAAARTRQTQFVPDVHAFEGHIACASSTQSEVVVPVLDATGQTMAVLDIDSDLPAAFTQADVRGLEALAAFLTTEFGASTLR